MHDSQVELINSITSNAQAIALANSPNMEMISKSDLEIVLRECLPFKSDDDMDHLLRAMHALDEGDYLRIDSLFESDAHGDQVTVGRSALR